MSPRTIMGSGNLGKSIRNRRQELGLTIEEAACKAGVGTKSWCRYEAGESIRKDKAKGVCKALNWQTIPGDNNNNEFNIEEYRNHIAWSPYICKNYGEAAAISFAIGSDIILDYIEEDLKGLSGMPKGSHIGQLQCSMMKLDLPEQFLTRYDYEFLYQLKATVNHLRKIAGNGIPFLAHSVMEELAIYLFMDEATFLMDCMYDEMKTAGIDGLDMRNDWAFELFDDMDIITFLFSDSYLDEGMTYHFDHWAKHQFFVEH